MAKAKYYNDETLKELKPSKSRETFVNVGDKLFLKITPTSKKVWYHYGKTRKWHRLGEFPSLLLADACNKNDEIKQDTDQRKACKTDCVNGPPVRVSASYLQR